MDVLRRAFYDPLIWLLRSFFQPAAFKKDFEGESFSKRMIFMLRVIPAMFFCTYPLALLVRSLLYAAAPSLYPDYTIQWGALWQPDALYFAFDAAWAALASCLVAGLFGGLFSLAYGISLGMAMSLGSAIIVNNMDEVSVSVVLGLSFGFIFGLTLNSSGALRREGLKATTLGIIGGIIGGMLIGVTLGTLGGFYSGMLIGILGGRDLQQSQSILGSIAGMFTGGIGSGLVAYVIGSIARGTVRGRRELVDVGAQISIAVASAFGVSVGVPVGDVGKSMVTLMAALAEGGRNGLFIGITFLFSYLISYFRLPLYPLDALSMLRSYLYSQKDPVHVIYHMYHCALHCDENVFLPLPYVRQLLLLAAHQNVDIALEEIDFVMQERSQQRGMAQAAAIEITLFDLSMRESLRDISRAYQRLNVTLSQEIRLTYPQVAKLFRYLEYASRDAASYYARTDRLARSEALESMLGNLRHIYPNNAFREAALNRLLSEVVQKWRVVAKHEQENIERADSFGHIENPYTPGLVLELRNPLFVGRQDLAQQLGEALRRSRRPTFFLTGERRMGKSSILQQLPDLLGSRYLAIFYDLQSTGIASSSAALFAAIAEGIYDLLVSRGMLIRKLTYEQLKEDQRDNEAVVYHSFGRWLKEVERVLDQEDRILLLTFDEFEKLEDAGQKGHIDLVLLLDWFRSVIQNRPRLALLFSGVKSMSDMGSDWAGYFINVETLKVSFLQPDEARQLIISPAPHFPGERIFSIEVVAEILRVTHCHPFLIQALCSIIITSLNYHGREQATVTDVVAAVDEVFKKWGEHYFGDLWDRTILEQRKYLRAMLGLPGGSIAQVQQRSGLDEAAAQRAIQKLVKRDLLFYEEGEYSISMPILAEWIEHFSIPHEHAMYSSKPFNRS